MVLPAALRGFVFLILLRHVVQSQSDWRVTYSPDKVCAVEGATVELRCTYTYPSRSYYRVTKSFWFRERYRKPLDLKDDRQYANRVTYSDGNRRVRITNVRKSDSAVYKFRLIDQDGGSYTGEGRVALYLTDLQVEASWRLSSKWVTLTCVSSCPAPQSASYIWYKDGQKIPETTTYSHEDHYGHSYSCALKDLESFPSAPACGYSSQCNKVTYTDRTICAPLGSSVDISCTHNRYEEITSKFWFSPERSDRWINRKPPKDLSADSQYTGRVQVFDDQRGRYTLKITNLTKSDSAEYRFKFTTWDREWGNDLHGTTLTVTDLQVQVKRIKVYQSSTKAELKCHSSCSEAERLSYIWFKNTRRIFWTDKSTYQSSFSHEDKFSCALNGHEEFSSPSVYAPKTPSVLLNASAVIVENSSVTLTCSTDANPAAHFTWFKKDESGDFQPFSHEEQLVFSSVQLSDAGEYRCSAENEFSQKTSNPAVIDVKYAPKLPSVSLSPSGKITEGGSVTLSCSSDANPAATYTWYKMDQTALQGLQGLYHFNTISSEDRGTYYCTSKNDYGQINSSPVFIDVQYSPRRPTVSQSPSVEIMEGSTVNLNCRGDANPAANYTWYKINRDTPVASGQTFTIRDIKLEQSGSYYCQAHNSIGSNNSTSHSIVVSASMKSVAAGSVTAVILVLIFLLIIFLYVRKKRSSKETNTPREEADIQRRVIKSSVNDNSPDATRRQPAEEQDLLYANVRFSKNQEDPLYSNVVKAKSKRPKKRKEEEGDDDVEYSVVKFKRGGATSESRYQAALKDASALYSTEAKKPRVGIQ